MRNHFLGRSDTPDWELAFTHIIYAHCAYSAGNLKAYRAAYAEATAALAAPSIERTSSGLRNSSDRPNEKPWPAFFVVTMQGIEGRWLVTTQASIPVPQP